MTLEFSLDPSYNGDLPLLAVGHVHNYYIRIGRTCMDHVNPKMKGPNGEILEIVIEDAHQVDSCIPKHRIQIGDKPSNAKYYFVDIQCSSITHEIAHLLGLWDEYYSENYQCRVVQDNSLLSRERTYLNRVFAKKLDDSLLAPSHFQSILYGDCSLRDDVKLYRRCSRLSYQTSSENACLVEKDYCDRQSVLGRDKVAHQQKISREIQDLQTELDKIDDWLSDNLDLSRGHPDHFQRTSKRSELLYRQEEIQERIPYLQKRLELVLSWPDSSISSP